MEEYSMHLFYELNPFCTSNGAIVFIKSFVMITPAYMPYHILEIPIPIHDEGKK